MLPSIVFLYIIMKLFFGYKETRKGQPIIKNKFRPKRTKVYIVTIALLLTIISTFTLAYWASDLIANLIVKAIRPLGIPLMVIGGFIIAIMILKDLFPVILSTFFTRRKRRNVFRRKHFIKLNYYKGLYAN
ncbi:MAG: hypothetical protein ACP6IP_10970 [Candidatus Njordarchaeia archaeon]